MAYLVNQYPKVSHSFIRREILALERQGLSIERYAVRGWDAEVMDPDDERELTRTRYLLRGGLRGLMGGVLASMAAAPIATIQALHTAWRLGHRRAERPWPLHLIYWAEACRLASWMKTGRATHLHAHFGTNAAEVAMLAAQITGRPFSFTVHGPEEFDRPEALDLGRKGAAAAAVVAISAYGRSQLFRWLPTAAWPRVQVVHCGLDDSYLTLAPTPVPSTPRLVCVGRLCEQKGQLLLLQALRRVLDEGVDVELVLAGDGDMRADVEREMARLDLTGHVRITGWLGGAQVQQEIMAARALVLPSFAEGLPVVLMEAMALGRPVISTYVAGIPELVVDGEHGWLVPAGDVDRLSAAMREALTAAPDHLAVMGHAARARALERHHIDHEAVKLRQIFDAVPGAGGQS